MFSPTPRRILYSLIKLLPKGSHRIIRWIENSKLGKLPDQPKTIKLNYSLKIIIEPAKNSLDRSLWVTGQYEPAIIDFLSRIVKTRNTYWDVGAHIGYHSLIVAHSLKTGQKVIALEPHSPHFAKLSKNIALNQFQHKITALPYGLSDKPGEKPFFDKAKDHEPAPSLVTGVYEASGEKAMLITGKQLLETIGNSKYPDVIKIDVEGYEGFVLRGIKEFTSSKQKAPILIFELSDYFLKHTPDTASSIISWLRNQNEYEFALERAKGFQKSDMKDIPQYCNVLAWIPSQHPEVETLLN